MGGHEGTALAIASAILATDGQIPSEPLADAILFAELGLDGRARPVRGSVVAAVAALRSGPRRIVVAGRNAAEAATVPGVEAVAVSSLHHWGQLHTRATIDETDWRRKAPRPCRRCQRELTMPPGRIPDVAEVLGQPAVVGRLGVGSPRPYDPYLGGWCGPSDRN